MCHPKCIFCFVELHFEFRYFPLPAQCSQYCRGHVSPVAAHPLPCAGRSYSFHLRALSQAHTSIIFSFLLVSVMLLWVYGSKRPNWQHRVSLPVAPPCTRPPPLPPAVGLRVPSHFSRVDTCCFHFHSWAREFAQALVRAEDSFCGEKAKLLLEASTDLSPKGSAFQ